MTKVLTIMFTDIKGFTERTASTSRESLRALLATHEELLYPQVRKFGGTLVKTIGDALLVTYESPTNAVLCGMMIQEVLREHNATAPPEDQISVRVAISSGEVELRDNDVFGEAVNIAARIEGITEASEIYFTESVYLAMNKSEVPSSEIGYRRLKGIPEPIKIYRVIQDRNSESYLGLIQRLKAEKFAGVALPSTGALPAAPGAHPANASRFRRSLLAALALAAVLAAGFFLHDSEGRRTAAIEKALELGETRVALAQAGELCRRMPSNASFATLEKVARRILKPALDEARFDDALKALDEIRAANPGFDGLRVERDLLLAAADHWRKRDNYAGMQGTYDDLLKKFPRDLDVRRHIVKNLGADYPDGPALIAVYAATQIADATTGEVDLLTGRTLVGGLKDFGPHDPSGEALRRSLAAHFPPAFGLAAALLADERVERRVNAYLLLKENGRLADTTEIAFHVFNLTTLETSYQKDLEAAVTFLDRRRTAPDWAAVKADPALPPVTAIRCLDEPADVACTVAVALLAAFPEAVEPILLAAVNQKEDYWLRCNAGTVLVATGRGDRFDLPAYHETNLATFPTEFTPVAFTAAVAYFEAFPDKARAAAALQGAADRIKTAYVQFERSGAKEYMERAHKNSDLVIAALERIAGASGK